jgi:NAD(P)-dependent dehydrogenase (short-subunit alcohol dehydrogenase family)
VNNAGIQPVPSCVPIHELPDELWHKVLSINLTGVRCLSLLTVMANNGDARHVLCRVPTRCCLGTECTVVLRFL